MVDSLLGEVDELLNGHMKSRVIFAAVTEIVADELGEGALLELVYSFFLLQLECVLKEIVNFVI
jgi:hypothetical protein